MTDNMRTGYPYFDRANLLLRSKFRAFADILVRSNAAFGDLLIREFEDMLLHLFPSEDLLAAGLQAYVKCAMNSLRLQAVFEKTGAYRGSSYEGASKRVYRIEDYMRSEYLPRVLLSHYLRPHHYR